MKKPLSLFLCAAVLTASMTALTVPAAAALQPQVSAQANDGAAKAKAKKNAKHGKKSKASKKAKHKKSQHAAPKRQG